jgi:hypothetical protein
METQDNSHETFKKEQDNRKKAMIFVANLIKEKHGNDVLQHWLWEMTPYPSGFATDKQLGEGLRLALSE